MIKNWTDRMRFVTIRCGDHMLKIIYKTLMTLNLLSQKNKMYKFHQFFWCLIIIWSSQDYLWVTKKIINFGFKIQALNVVHINGLIAVALRLFENPDEFNLLLYIFYWFSWYSFHSLLILLVRVSFSIDSLGTRLILYWSSWYAFQSLLILFCFLRCSLDCLSTA